MENEEVKMIEAVQAALRNEMQMAGVTYAAAAEPLGYAHKSSAQRAVNGGKLYLQDVITLMVLCRSKKLVAATGKKTLVVTLNCNSIADVPELFQALLHSVQESPEQGRSPLKHGIFWKDVMAKVEYTTEGWTYQTWFYRQTPFFMALAFLDLGFPELSGKTDKASVTIRYT